MAGRGPAPGANPNRKPADRRARRGSPDPNLRVITAPPAPQPDLPGDDWHPQTVEWWRMWAESPLSEEFTANDWSELMDAARIHSAFWSGELRYAAELRLRVANFGATPADRARLRITFAQADEADSKRTPPVSSKGRRGPLTALPDVDAG